MPTCAVIIPSFNSVKFIDVALFSLKAQTRRPDEVIIVDAGSVDGTRELVNTFREALNIEFITAPRSSMGVARNSGIRAATSDIISFLDSDDIFLANHVEMACRIFADPGVDAVHGYQLQWNSTTDKLEMGYDYERPLDHELEIFESSLINLSTLTIRKTISDKEQALLFSENLRGRYCEDWDFCLRLIASGIRVHYQQEPVSVVTERSGSHTRKSIFWKMRFSLLRSLLEQKPRIPC